MLESVAAMHAEPPNPLSRRRVLRQALDAGVRALDGVSCGKGQRMGIFADSGVGKSVNGDDRPPICDRRKT